MLKKKEKQFELKLSEPLAYQHPGGESKTDTLLFKAFSRNHMCKHENNLFEMREKLDEAYISLVKKMAVFTKNAESKKTEEKENEDSEGITSDSMTFNLFMSCIEGKADYRNMFWDLILDGLCFLDEKITLTKDLKNDMSMDDQSIILSEYTRNFILPSWIKQQFAK